MRILYTLGLLLLVTLLMAKSCEEGVPICRTGQDCPCAILCPDGVVAATCSEGTCDCTCLEPGTGGTGGTSLSCETTCGELDCVEFADGDFNESDWVSEVVQVTPPPGSGEFRVDQGGVPGSIGPDDGNPAPYHFVAHIVGERSGIWVAHEKPAANYDPGSAGPIESIHYSVDGKALPGSRQASLKALAKQDGLWFWTTNLVLINENEDEDGWVTKDWDDGQLGPVRSGELNLVDGALITFGFYTGASHTTGVPEVTRNTGVDNWRVFICKEPPSP